MPHGREYSHCSGISPGVVKQKHAPVVLEGWVWTLRLIRGATPDLQSPSGDPAGGSSRLDQRMPLLALYGLH